MAVSLPRLQGARGDSSGLQCHLCSISEAAREDPQPSHVPQSHGRAVEEQPCRDEDEAEPYGLACSLVITLPMTGTEPKPLHQPAFLQLGQSCSEHKKTGRGSFHKPQWYGYTCKIRDWAQPGLLQGLAQMPSHVFLHAYMYWVPATHRATSPWLCTHMGRYQQSHSEATSGSRDVSIYGWKFVR